MLTERDKAKVREHFQKYYPDGKINTGLCPSDIFDEYVIHDILKRTRRTSSPSRKKHSRSRVTRSASMGGTMIFVHTNASFALANTKHNRTGRRSLR